MKNGKVPGAGAGCFVDEDERMLYCIPGEWNMMKYLNFCREETKHSMENIDK